MSWYYATRDVPFLKDYAAAVTYESNVKPIRGRSPEVKPLGSRKKYYYNIKKVDDGKGGVDIHIRYDTEPMIIFRSDGYIVVSGLAGYSSTHGVQGKILGAHLCQHDYGPWISRVLAPCDPDGDKCGAFPLREGPNNLFRREADGYLRYVNPLYPTKHVVKRAEMNAVRKKYPEFRKFASAMIKLQGEGTPITTEFMSGLWGSEENHLWQNGRHITKKPGLRIHYPHGRTPEETKELIESGDSAKWADAVTFLCWANNKWNTTWDLGVFKRALDKTLMNTHADKVFEKKTITTGKWVEDPNGKFFK
jgi:hypothetical protein